MRISDWSSDVCSSDLLRYGRVQRRRKGQPEHIASLHGVNHPIVPQARRCVPGAAFVLICFANRRFESLGLFGCPALCIAVHACEYACRLFSPHNADPAVGPGETETLRISPATTPQIPC